jgi:hypothetical protein
MISSLEKGRASLLSLTLGFPAATWAPGRISPAAWTRMVPLHVSSRLVSSPWCYPQHKWPLNPFIYSQITLGSQSVSESRHSACFSPSEKTRDKALCLSLIKRIISPVWRRNAGGRRRRRRRLSPADRSAASYAESSNGRGTGVSPRGSSMDTSGFRRAPRLRSSCCEWVTASEALYHIGQVTLSRRQRGPYKVQKGRVVRFATAATGAMGAGPDSRTGECSAAANRLPCFDNDGAGKQFLCALVLSPATPYISNCKSFQKY